MANRVKANVIGSKNWSLGPMVQYRGKRDDDVENDKVKEMREVDPAVEVGGFLGVTPGNWHLTVLLGQDVNDAHDGMVAVLEGGYTMPLEKGVKLGITAFTSYVDDDYMETYFSVDADNAGRSGLDEYEAEGGMKDYGVMLNLAYAPWTHWGITGILGWKQLIGDAADSPVVEDEGSDGQPFAGVMATYRF
jgi:outer membrane protein